jgi:PhzF family phenazine biosynthesis protein
MDEPSGQLGDHDRSARCPVALLNVFTFEGKGGNPCPIVADAGRLAPADMQDLARRFGVEAGFVLPSESGDYDFTFRFWVPRHEMEMCGHAAIGALWQLAEHGRLPADMVRVETRSGPVTGFISYSDHGERLVEITQPAGRVASLTPQQEKDVLAVLGLEPDDLLDLPLQNGVTSRVKTLIPIREVERLHALRAGMPAIEALCRRIGSTGLYPYAVLDQGARIFEARQFPRSSGYPEDAATGIAASALAFGLLRNGLVGADDRTIRVFQGRAMGRLSEIRVRLGWVGRRAIGCLLSGTVTPAELAL